MKTTFEVEITNIEIDDFYFLFNYRIVRNGEEIDKGEYQSDHSWRDDKKGFKKLLENHEAALLALEQIR